MPLEIWPATLPRDFLASDFTNTLSDGLLKDEYNVGPLSYRRRTTAAPANFSGTMVMSTAEWITLRSFFHTTLFDGAVRFLFPPQGTIDEARFWITRFLTPPKRQLSNADDLWFVALEMERLGIGTAFLIPQLFTNQNTIYSPRLIYDQLLTAARYNDPDNFRIATVIGTGADQGLLPVRYNDADTFYAPTVTLPAEGQTLTAVRYNDADTFYSPTVSAAGGGGGGAWAESSWGEA